MNRAKDKTKTAGLRRSKEKKLGGGNPTAQMHMGRISGNHRKRKKPVA